MSYPTRVERLFDVDDFRAAVRATFAAVRKQNKGAIARLNFSCCVGCAGYELAAEKKNHGKPAIFFHAQDQDRYAGGRMYVKFGWVRNSEEEAAGNMAPEDDAVVGRMVVVAAIAQGLLVDWDGTADQTVVLVANDKVQQWYELRDERTQLERASEETQAQLEALREKMEAL